MDAYFANCTCGSLSGSQVIWYCIVPSAISISAGLLVAAFSRLRSALPWLLLAMAVSLSMIVIVPDWSYAWTQVADPREWRDWFRVPAVAYQAFFTASWPAWLVLFAVYSFRSGSPASTAWWAVSPTLVMAALKTLVAVGSSESFRSVAALHRVLESTATATSVVLFFCLALTPWTFGRRWALGSLILAAAASAVLYWPAPAPRFHPGWMYDETFYYRTPEIVGACFTAAVLLVIVAAE